MGAIVSFFARRPFASAAAALLLALGVSVIRGQVLKSKLSGARADLDHCRTSIAVERANVEDLQAAIDAQNIAIDQWAGARDAVARDLDTATENNRRLDRELGTLRTRIEQSAEPRSCPAAVDQLRDQIIEVIR